MTPGRFAISLLAVLLLSQGSRTLAGEEHHLPLRNHNPFLQATGLPVFQGATLTGAGRTDFRLALDLANHADAGGGKGEVITLDGETTTLTLSWRYGWSDRIELGVDVPVVSHNSGFLDGPVADWHDLFGLSNGNRAGLDNRLLIAYEGAGIPPFRLDSAATAPGDLQLSAAYALGGSRAALWTDRLLRQRH